MCALITMSATQKKQKQRKEKNMSENKHKYQIKFHERWCAETAGLGMCNCSPKIIPTETDDWSIINRDGRLTCGMCGYSARGKIYCKLVEDSVGNTWKVLRTNV